MKPTGKDWKPGHRDVATLGRIDMPKPAIMDTPEQINTFHLIQLKQAVKLEGLGMIHSSGKSVTAHAKKMLGLPAGASREKVMETLEDRIDENISRS